MIRKLWPILVLAALVLASLACGIAEPATKERSAAAKFEGEPVKEAAPAETQEPEGGPVEEAVEEQPEEQPVEEAAEEPQPEEAIATEVVAINWYTDITGYLNFVGVIKNTGTVPLEFVKPVVTLRDAQGEMVALEFTYTELDVIEPGGTSPFILFFTDDVGEWTDYEIMVEADEAVFSEPYKDLEIISHNGSADEFTDYIIEGEVKNIGSEDAVFVEISAALYDADDNLVAVAFTFTVLDTVVAGGTSPFEIFVLDSAGEIDHYELYVEGQTE
jgi:hypothetical protein